MTEETQTVVAPKKRTRKCKEIIGVTKSDIGLKLVPNWPTGITRANKAIEVAKKIQTEWAQEIPEVTPVVDIILIRRIATLKGSSQVVMAFKVD